MDWVGAPVAVIGAGGAARAILFALAQADVSDVTILARSPLKAAALLSHFGLKGKVLPMDAALPSVALLVNTSPLGMVGQLPLMVDLSPLPGDATVYDIVYTPLETGLLKAARQRDLETVDGLDMLIGQAALAFELLFGQAPPEDCEDELRELLLK
jgi:shikimate dehydrogenase